MDFDHKRVIAKLLGEFRTPREIIRYMDEHYHVAVRDTSIRSVLEAKTWSPMIAHARSQYLAEVLNTPLKHERVRLDRLEQLYQQSHETEIRTKQEAAQNRRERLEILRAAREEAQRAEGLTTTNILAIQFNSLSDDELKQKRDELLKSLPKLGGTGHGTQGPESVVVTEQGSQAA